MVKDGKGEEVKVTVEEGERARERDEEVLLSVAHPAHPSSQSRAETSTSQNNLAPKTGRLGGGRPVPP